MIQMFSIFSMYLVRAAIFRTMFIGMIINDLAQRKDIGNAYLLKFMNEVQIIPYCDFVRFSSCVHT